MNGVEFNDLNHPCIYRKKEYQGTKAHSFLIEEAIALCQNTHW